MVPPTLPRPTRRVSPPPSIIGLVVHAEVCVGGTPPHLSSSDSWCMLKWGVVIPPLPSINIMVLKWWYPHATLRGCSEQVT